MTAAPVPARWSKYAAFPHLQFLVTESKVDETGVFQRMSSFDDARLGEVFAREVLGFHVGRELLSPEWAERVPS